MPYSEESFTLPDVDHMDLDELIMYYKQMGIEELKERKKKRRKRFCNSEEICRDDLER